MYSSFVKPKFEALARKTPEKNFHPFIITEEEFTADLKVGETKKTGVSIVVKKDEVEEFISKVPKTKFIRLCHDLIVLESVHRHQDFRQFAFSEIRENYEIEVKETWVVKTKLSQVKIETQRYWISEYLIVQGLRRRFLHSIHVSQKIDPVVKEHGGCCKPTSHECCTIEPIGDPHNEHLIVVRTKEPRPILWGRDKHDWRFELNPCRCNSCWNLSPRACRWYSHFYPGDVPSPIDRNF